MESTPVGNYSDKSWYGLHMDSNPLHSTPVKQSLGGLGCGESPLESNGVHMEYGGDRQDLPIFHRTLLVMVVSCQWRVSLLCDVMCKELEMIYIVQKGMHV